MPTNPILQELYAARAEIIAQYDNDLGAYIESANERLLASGRPIADITPRTIQRSGLRKSNHSIADDNPPLR